MSDERSTLGWSDLPGARVGVWGLGREGGASLRKLRSLGVDPVLVDDNPQAGSDLVLPAKVLPAKVLPTKDGGLDALSHCEIVIKTPGISRYGPEADHLRAAGVILVGGLGLWLQEADRNRVVCVTGTKGKSTTSAVLGHLLRGLGYQVMVGGNIGAAPYDPEHAGRYDYWVIEVSSYTATDLAVTPPVTAVTSLHPDHLPWHGTVEHYYRDKLSATSQPGAELTVANGDSELLRERAGLLGPKVEWVSESDEPSATWMNPLELPGGHNRRNTLIARRVLTALGIAAADDNLIRVAADDAALARAAVGFTPLPSRLTTVGTVDGIAFIDDSLSTNVLPTLAALDAFPDRRIALIVGGQDRGIDYAPLAAGVCGRADPTLVLTLPDSGPRISAAFAAHSANAAAHSANAAGPTHARDGFAGVRDCPDLDVAVAAGFEWARPDGIVLLSPAAPSFGHFRDYRDRGDQFAAAMRTCGSR
jgi:UDP-N-acetylmuramoylalanine--D-glutamate ligase